MTVVVMGTCFNLVWSSTRWKKQKIKLMGTNTIVLNNNLTNRDDYIPLIVDLLNSDNILKDDDGKRVWLKHTKAIANGSFSSVYMCKNSDTVVIKLLTCTNNNNTRIMFENEITAYKTFTNSDYTPRLYGYGTNFIVIEKYKYDLKSVLSILSPTIDNLKHVCRSIVLCLKYIHDCGIVHCDLKPANILVSSPVLSSCKIVLADFGLSKTVKDDVGGKERIKHRFGTYKYMSTTIHSYKYPTRKSDLESFGYILWELFGGTLPWKKMRDVVGIFELKQHFNHTNPYFKYLSSVEEILPTTYDYIIENFVNGANWCN